MAGLSPKFHAVCLLCMYSLIIASHLEHFVAFEKVEMGETDTYSMSVHPCYNEWTVRVHVDMSEQPTDGFRQRCDRGRKDW